MYAYQQAAPAPQNKNGVDVAAWALVALIVALLCGAVGWFVASNDVLGRGDMQEQAELAAREGAARGVRAGYSQGAKQGRQQAGLQAQLSIAQGKRTAADEGYSAGYSTGRSRAEARRNGYSTGMMSSYDAYPAQDYSDVLSSSLLNDEPGYSTSAFDEFGYGTSAGSAYGATSPLSSAALTPGF